MVVRSIDLLVGRLRLTDRLRGHLDRSPPVAALRQIGENAGVPSSGSRTEKETLTIPRGAPDPRASLSLLVSGSAGAKLSPLGTADSVVLGRSDECGVVIEDTSVSRKHAVLRLTPRPTIEDLGSHNGTTVQHRRIEPGTAVPIDVGTLVELGEAAVVLVRAPRLPAVQATPSDSGKAVVYDSVMRQLYAMLDLVAGSDLSVLLQGETGVGKEVLASELHARSARRSAPFVAINCASLPESILESELFGHERGAFTGADRAKPGLFEAAEGGTVFLDEIGELPLAAQAKLLRVLESGEVLRLGSVKPRVVDMRFVAATNRDLAARSESGEFRADLFFRINGITLSLPPLRERKDDILPLARHFLTEAAARQGIVAVDPTERAIEALERYTWPGNVRELRNVIERAFVLSKGAAIDEPHLMLAGGGPSRPPREQGLRDEVGAFEKQRLLDALERAEGNHSWAAKFLGVSRRTLLHKMDAYGIQRPQKKGAKTP
jgi:DNA-binding NtrC family response regulator